MNMPAPCTIPCNLCGSVDAEQIRTKDRHGAHLRSVICRQCGLVWTDPRPAPEQVREFYAQEYRLGFKGTYQPKPKHTYRSGKVAVERYQRLRNVLKTGMRVLDVGAGGGEVVYVLRAMGYDATGFEPNEGYARYAAEVLGLPVRRGFHQDCPVEPASQDVVTMFHMVEHLESPFDALRNVHGWLRPEGLIVVEVPNAEAVCQQPHTQFHRGHLYHFNLPALEKTGERAGFTVVSRFTSADGGNIMVVWRKTQVSPATSSSWAIPGNYARVAAILRGHTTLRHVFSRYPFIRPFRKLASGLEEQRRVRMYRSPRDILDAVIAENAR